VHKLFYPFIVNKQTLRWWVLGLFSGFISSQENSFAQVDSSGLAQKSPIVSLSAVTVRAISPERFLVGQPIQHIDSTTLRQFQFGSLVDLLALNTPIAFKNYGPGQLATVAFRGTSAIHTAVLWNGININQPNLGLTDFSTLPVAGFDKLAVQYGSSASVVGSGAVGGSILLGSNADWQRKFSVTLGQQFASFHNNQTQAGVRYTTALGQNWKLSGKTFAYRNKFNNVYPYTERLHYFLEPSTTVQRGFVQDLYLLHKSGKQVSVNAWLSDNDLIITPLDTIARERTRTQSARLLATYEANRLTVRLGWIRDVLDYGKGNFNTPDHTGTERLISRAEREFTLISTPSRQLNLRIGGEWSHYRTQTDGYGDQLIQEDREDVYALMRFQTARWLLSANIRQAFVTRFNPPLTPSFGAEYQLIQRNRFTLTAKGAISRNYRVPTLNERYWIELGNPNLKPESGVNMETSLAAKATLSDNLALTTELTTYHNRVDNWTYWNPAKEYHVENLQLVVARGLEFTMGLVYTQNQWQAGIRLGYAYTRSSQERVYGNYAQDVVGKQLPYVPIHTGTANAWLQRGKTRLSVQAQTNSRRYFTADNSQFLKGNTLVNLLLEHTAKLGPVPVRVQGNLNNLFDALVVGVKQNALPGRNGSINLIVNFSSVN
jgi:vitamin B12 transporter